MVLKRCVFVVLSFYILQIINGETSATMTDAPTVSISGYMDKQIKTELSGCNLKIGITGLKSCSASRPPDVPVPGPPGERGEIGPAGPQGPIGPVGPVGPAGPPGPMGPKGETIPGINGIPGNPGLKGDVGPQGLPGAVGQKGDTGDTGLNGLPGPKGDTGRLGFPGLLGPMGPPGVKGETGLPGKDCVKEGLPGSESAGKVLGSNLNPAKSCAELQEDGVYYINPSDPFEVTCKVMDKKTCLKIEEFDGEMLDAINFDNRAFWLSNKGFDMKKLYNLEVSQLSYLLATSTGVSQSIKYHCYNSVLSLDTDKQLQMLLWNDKIVGPESSKATPMSYKIVDNTCQPQGDTWESADIELESNLNTRLPVIDFYIQDIRSTVAQKVLIKLNSLCFNFKKPTSST